MTIGLFDFFNGIASLGIAFFYGAISVAFLALNLAIFVGFYKALSRKQGDTWSEWSILELELKRRYDLVPTLIEIIKQSPLHNTSSFETMIATCMTASVAQIENDIERLNEPEKLFSQALAAIVNEASRDQNIRAMSAFQAFQRDLTTIQYDVAACCKRYNESVDSYNAMLTRFPGSVFGKLFGFRSAPFFYLEEWKP